MKIDELARRTGMTVRNIRAHQSRGLLPPPDVRGRTGYYGPRHLERIELIRELQADGLNLEAIRRLLEGADHAGSEVLDFARLLRAPFEDEEPEIVDGAEIAARWDITDDDRARRLTKQARDLGLLRPMRDGRIEVSSPSLGRAANELADLGISPEEALDFLAAVRGHADQVAHIYLDLFLGTIWAEFNRAGRPEGEWPRVIEALRRLRPLVMQSVVTIFGISMSEITEGALERLGFPAGGDGSDAGGEEGQILVERPVSIDRD